MRAIVAMIDIHLSQGTETPIRMIQTMPILRAQILSDYRKFLRQKRITTGLLREKFWKKSELGVMDKS